MPLGIAVLAASGCAALVGAFARPRLLPASSSPGVPSVGPMVRRVLALLRRERSAPDDDRALLDAIGSTAEHLRSGAALQEAFGHAGAGLQGRIGAAFLRFRDRTELGTPFDVALAAWAEEVSTPEARLVAAMVGLQRRTGGMLARTLEELGGALRRRLEAEADLRALTAQARLSAWIVGLLPIGFLAFLLLVSGPDLVAVFRTPAGGMCLLVGLGLEAAGAMWVRRILAVTR